MISTNKSAQYKQLESYALDDDIINKILVAQDKLSECPVRIVELCKEVGISEVEMGEFSKDISGMIKKKNVKSSEEYIIITNMNEPEHRRRFTIAHELAHFLLHKDQIGDGIIEDTLYRSKLTTDEEIEANRLAADILIPKNKLDDYINRSEVTVRDLADKFGVSVSAVRVRLGIPL